MRQVVITAGENSIAGILAKRKTLGLKEMALKGKVHASGCFFSLFVELPYTQQSPKADQEIAEDLTDENKSERICPGNSERRERGDRHKLIHAEIARCGRDGAGKPERGEQDKGLLN